MGKILISIALIAGLLLASIPIAWKAHRQRRRIKLYRKILHEINELFSGINAFEISKKTRALQKYASHDLTYGEIDICALLDLLAIAQPKPSALYYELGSGCGKSAFAVKLMHPTLRVNAIELMDELHVVAEKKLQEYVDKNGLTAENFGLSLICANLLNHNFSDADLIFINATGFSPSTWTQIMYRLIQLRPGAKIIITSKSLPKPFFNKIYQGMELMSWGLTSTYIYEKMI